jgi:hypothetical protein
MILRSSKVNVKGEVDDEAFAEFPKAVRRFARFVYGAFSNS